MDDMTAGGLLQCFELQRTHDAHEKFDDFSLSIEGLVDERQTNITNYQRWISLRSIAASPFSASMSRIWHPLALPPFTES